jgi:hypothetical protein
MKTRITKRCRPTTPHIRSSEPQAELSWECSREARIRGEESWDGLRAKSYEGLVLAWSPTLQ